MISYDIIGPGGVRLLFSRFYAFVTYDAARFNTGKTSLRAMILGQWGIGGIRLGLQSYYEETIKVGPGGHRTAA